MSERIDLERFPVHLGLDARIHELPEFTGEMSWYEKYGAEHVSDGREGRLVSLHTFREPWTSWEMHPTGEELVVCLSGKLTLIQEHAGEPHAVELGPHQAAINPAGVWHTADAEGEVSALFITAGLGTEVRAR